MKTIKLKSLRLINFKGVRDYRIDFGEKITRIYGANGTGKTTLFDAFVWVLFGKDSQDRKQFDIKTLDSNGVVIPRLPHEVEAVIDVDGETINLRRTYSEKWTKRRGSLEEEQTGHEEGRFYNNVPCSVKEWEQKMDAICPENVFKFITNPRFFSAQKANVQRQMLFELAGGITDEAVAGGNAEFEQLLQEITGKSLEEFKREIMASKRRIKAEADGIPERMDERKRDIAALEEIDYSEAEKVLITAEKRLAEIDAILEDRAKIFEQEAIKKRDILDKITSCRIKVVEEKKKALSEASAGYDLLQEKMLELTSQRAEWQRNLDEGDLKMKMQRTRLESICAELNRLSAEWQKIADEKLVFTDTDFICPTCGRRYEVEEIESRQGEITRRFNESKALRINQNNAKGIELSQKRTEVQDELQKWDSYRKSRMHDIQLLNEEIEDLEQKMESSQKIDIDKVLSDNLTVRALNTKIEMLEHQLEELNSAKLDDVDSVALREEKSSVNGKILRAHETLGKRTEIVRHKTRIETLEAQYRALQQELSNLEKKEYIITEFGKTKVRMIEDRINSLFHLVRFKMFDTQVNGEEVECCEATVSGVPYSSVNNAAQIQAGVDIINAICRNRGILAPIVLDNSEAMNELPETESQVIALYVSEGNKLIIK